MLKLSRLHAVQTRAHDVGNSAEPVVSASYTAEVGTLIPQWSKKHTSSPLDVQK